MQISTLLWWTGRPLPSAPYKNQEGRGGCGEQGLDPPGKGDKNDVVAGQWDDQQGGGYLGLAPDGPVTAPMFDERSENFVVGEEAVETGTAASEAPSGQEDKGGGGQQGKDQADGSEGKKENSQDGYDNF